MVYSWLGRDDVNLEPRPDRLEIGATHGLVHDPAALGTEAREHARALVSQGEVGETTVGDPRSAAAEAIDLLERKMASASRASLPEERLQRLARDKPRLARGFGSEVARLDPAQHALAMHPERLGGLGDAIDAMTLDPSRIWPAWHRSALRDRAGGVLADLRQLEGLDLGAGIEHPSADLEEPRPSPHPAPVLQGPDRHPPPRRQLPFRHPFHLALRASPPAAQMRQASVWQDARGGAEGMWPAPRKTWLGFQISPCFLMLMSLGA